jgi:hypothetical protein
MGPKNDDDYLHNVTNIFLKEVLVKEQSLSHDQASDILEKGHADILWVDKSSDKGKDYRIKDKDFDEMFKFLEYRALHLRKRFIIVNEADHLSYALCNKLLKTLEEPNKNAVIIFLAPQDTHFIQTIVSRASIWNISPKLEDYKRFTEFKNFKQFLDSDFQTQNKDLKEFLSKELYEQLQRSNKTPDIGAILNVFLDYESNNKTSISHKTNLLKLIQKYEQDKAFHGPNGNTLGRLFNMYR